MVKRRFHLAWELETADSSLVSVHFDIEKYNLMFKLITLYYCGFPFLLYFLRCCKKKLANSVAGKVSNIPYHHRINHIHRHYRKRQTYYLFASYKTNILFAHYNILIYNSIF